MALYPAKSSYVTDSLLRVSAGGTVIPKLITIAGLMKFGDLYRG